MLYISSRWLRLLLSSAESSNVGTWDMEEFLAMEDEIVAGDKLKVRMVV